MSTLFPNNLDDATSLPVEAASTALSVNHVTAHQNVQDAIEAIEAKVGVDSSAVTTSHDYKLSAVTGSDKALKSGTSTQSVTGLTLASPKITVGSDAVGDLHYVSNVDGTQSRLAKGNDNQILKMNGTALNWEDEITTVNASTTVAGIVELATTAQVTAGTATGETGAALVVTPDGLAASTPVFNGSGITAIPRWLASGVPGTTVSNTTTTVLTYALAGGTLSTNKGVRIRLYVSISNSAANASATITVKYGGTSICSLGGYSAQSGTPTFTSANVLDILLYGSGATGTQISLCSAIEKGSTTPATGPNASTATSSIDSTASQNITVELTTSSAGATATFTGYFIEKIV